MIDTKRLATDAAYWDEVAPEGATHWDMEAGLFVSPTHVYTLGGKQGRQYRRALANFGRYIPHPRSEWVDGLPPAGIVCEMIHPGIEDCGWQKVQIKAYFDDRVAIKGSENVWSNSSGYAAIKIDGELRFRPIRTNEQRLRDELAELISEHLELSGSFVTPENTADAILSRYNLKPKP